MPNWCVGDLKIRGTKQQIIIFLTDAVKAVQQVSYTRNSEGENDVTSTEYNISVEKSDSSFEMRGAKEGFYFKGTRRNFYKPKKIEFWFSGENEEEVFVFEDVQCAWSVDAEGFKELSEKFKVDIKFYGFEREMAFNQELEIVQGKIIKFNDITFDDYEWECIRPSVGG